MPTLSPATTSTGTAAAAYTDVAPLLCSDVDLACSDLLDCADNGAVVAASSTGTLVAA